MIKLQYKTKDGWQEYINTPAFVHFFLEANIGSLFTEFKLSVEGV